MPDFISCCNELSRANWLKLIARFKRKLKVKSQRAITVKAKLESPEEIARLMAMKPKWSRNDGIQ